MSIDYDEDSSREALVKKLMDSFAASSVILPPSPIEIDVETLVPPPLPPEESDEEES